MRRRRRKKHYIWSFLIIAIIFLSVASFGYAYLSSVLSISGHVTGQISNEDYTIQPGSDPYLSISITKTNNWQEGGLYKYQYSFFVKNIGGDTIDNFKLTINFSNNISDAQVWNYDRTISNKTLTITDTNYTLTPNQTLNVGAIISSNSAMLVIRSVKLEVNRSGNQVPLDKFNVAFNITGTWGQYTYQYNVTVTNKTNTKITSWQLVITLPEGTTYVSGWNAIFTSVGNKLTIKNESYNGKLNVGASASFGLQLSTNIINFIPSNIVVTVI